MDKSLIIVESPTKARTISKFLGKDYIVKASVGHIKDLPKTKLGVDIENGFEPHYIMIRGKKKIIDELKKASKHAKEIYLAPDPDREGEAIAWHIAEVLGDKKKAIRRILIHEITPRGVAEALKHYRPLSESLYRAQQARRILDRLVGYKISPLLWQKVKRGLSAGRVQSVALKLICDREREIKAFVPQEYWSIEAKLRHPKAPPDFVAKLAQLKGEKVELHNQAQAQAIVADLQGKTYVVSEVTKKEKRRNPPPPFITSTLQQEASRKLRFSAKKTMYLAQQLYEGIDLGDLGMVGLITYMRTDSVRLSQDAVEQVRKVIRSQFGEDYLPDRPNVYKSRTSAQEAHEAIRPTSLDLPPERLKGLLNEEQYALYKLIWDRFLACQMRPALYDQTSVKVLADDYLFMASGSVMKFAGFTAVYVEGEDTPQQAQEDSGVLPPLSVGDRLELVELVTAQHFTQPPPRYTESSLVRELEEKGIGRPSTYATIISNLLERRYVELIERRFHPTELGLLVADLLMDNFPAIMDVGFTAQMEENLDKIESQALHWQQVLKDFYQPFEQDLKKAEENMRDVKAERTPTDIRCELCGSMMEIRWGRFGKFLSCTSYPDCKNAKMFRQDRDGRISVDDANDSEEECPQCGSPMVVKEGRYGRFLACSRYPECKGTRSIGMGVACPEPHCGGELVQKRTRKGRLFYGCNKYPACHFAIWQRPVPKRCPKCGAAFLIEKRGKDGLKYVCRQEGCDYLVAADEKVASG